MKRPLRYLTRTNFSTTVSSFVVGLTLLFANPIPVKAQAIAESAQHERIEAQETRYRNAIRRNSADVHAYNQLADLLMQQKRYEDAVAVYRDITEVTPSAQAFSDLGLALNFQQQHEASEEAYRKAIELDSSFADAQRGLGDALIYQGRSGEAQLAYKAALELDSQLPEALLGMGIALLAQEQDYEWAIFMQAALAKNPDLNTVNHIQAEILWRTIIAASNPEEAKHHYLLAHALEAKNQLEAAETAYRETIWIDASYQDAYYYLGNLLLRQDRPGDAISAYQSGVQATPTVYMYYGLGWALEVEERYSEAEVAYQQAVQLDPSSSDSQFRLGYVLMMQERYDAAEAAYRETLKLNPSYLAETHLALGLMLFYQGDEAMAREHFETAFTLKPALMEQVEQYIRQS